MIYIVSRNRNRISPFDFEIFEIHRKDSTIQTKTRYLYFICFDCEHDNDNEFTCTC